LILLQDMPKPLATANEPRINASPPAVSKATTKSSNKTFRMIKFLHPFLSIDQPHLSSSSNQQRDALYTTSVIYFFFNNLQNTTAKAVKGTASIIPRMPPRATPQKNTAKTMRPGCRPVRLPIILGVRR